MHVAACVRSSALVLSYSNRELHVLRAPFEGFGVAAESVYSRSDTLSLPPIISGGPFIDDGPET
jgi:hypothetical protein